jgi:hypothetical protein
MAKTSIQWSILDQIDPDCILLRTSNYTLPMEAREHFSVQWIKAYIYSEMEGTK